MRVTRRRAALIAASSGLLLLGTTVVTLSRLDVDRYRDQVQAVLAERLHRTVSVGPMHVSLRPVGIRIENGLIAEDPAFSSERPFASAAELYVSLNPLALLRGRVDLRSIELRQPAIELIRNAAGVWNFASFGKAGRSENRVLKRLVIRGGEVAITDLTARDPRRAVYRNIDLIIDHYATGRPFDLALTATLPGTGVQHLTLRGEAGPLDDRRITQTPFTGEMEFEDVSLSGLRRFLIVDTLQDIDAAITGAVELHTRSGRLSSQGTLRLNGARVHGQDIGYPVSAQFALEHDANTGLLTIKPSVVRLDDTPVRFDGTVNITLDTPVLDVHVKTSDASFAETARLASAFGIAFGAGTNVQGRFTADMRLRGPARRPAFDGQAQLRDITISGRNLPHPVRTPAVDLAMTPREIRSKEFTASSNGTAVAVRFVLTDYTAARPVVDATIRTDADMADALNVARAWGLDAVAGLSGTGRVTLDVRVSGPTDALTYTGNAALRDATLQPQGFAQPLRVRTADIRFAPDAAVLDPVVATLGRTNVQGRVTVRNFASPDVEFQLSADRMDVAELQHLLAQVPPGQPPQPRAQPTSVLLRTTGFGHLRAGAVVYKQLLLENVEADAQLDRGIVTLQPLTASVYGGQQRGSVVVDSRRTPATFTVTSEFERVDANRLASATTDLKDVLYGALNSSERVTFTTDGAADIARSLNGTLSVTIPDGRIAHMDLLHEIGALARFVKGDDGDQQITKVRNLRAHFTVINGVAQTSDLTATIDDDATIGGAGSIDLATQALNLRLTAVLSRAFSDLVGGTRVGGIMSTVLANRRGELVVPMLVTGTMRQPRFAPDVERVAEMKLREMVPDIRDPQKLSTAIDTIVGTITGRGAPPPARPDDEGEGEQSPATTKPEPKKPAKQIEDVLREILERGTKKQSTPGK